MNICPCCSGLEFNLCCEPIILNYSARSAEQLMRSRYTAYVLKNVEYIFKTSTKNIQKSFNKNDITNWISKTKWLKLEVVFSIDNKVEFKAYYTEVGNTQIQIHHEISTFLCEDNRWYYEKGEWVD